MDGHRSALVVGAVRSGLAAARALTARGVEVRLHDRRVDAVPEPPPGVEVACGDVRPGRSCCATSTCS